MFIGSPLAYPPDIPVDIELLAESYSSIDSIDIIKNLYNRYATKGILFRLKKDCFIIQIDEYHYEKYELSARFTIAEEFSHSVLHSEIMNESLNIDDVINLRKDANSYTLERNARWLASALLMPPEPLLKMAGEYYIKMVGIAGFGNPQAIILYIISELSKRFAVNSNAMEYRIENYPINLPDKVTQAMINSDLNLP